mmetsp:Transcript_13752/g.34524  ORF Transcript_13752/g.34524 Transcript_13752/m.34524 type:complete len:223 (-) Transcript_13752:35-703(-)
MFMVVLIIYVFAIIFRNIASGTALEEAYFQTVPQAMGWLLLTSVCPDVADIINGDFAGAGFHLALAYFLFIVLISFLVLNLLIGVLVNVVGVVATVEKERLQFQSVREQLEAILKDWDSDSIITKTEFRSLLVEREICASLTAAGVDCLALVELTDTIFTEEKPELEVHELVDILLTLRGGNIATVKDCVDVRRLLMLELRKLESKLDASVCLTSRKGNCCD